MLAPQLLELLVDPEDHGSLFYIADEELLYNPRLKRSYAVRDTGIPVMLTSDATAVTDHEHTRLMKLVQRGELRPTGGTK